MNNFNLIISQDKVEIYALLAKQLEALVEGERHVIPNLANTSALIFDTLQDINWAGFYLINDDYLLLAPFQGKPACIKIPISRGVCGKAVSTNTTQLIADVHKFDGHIACDCASNSEIVIPIHKNGIIVGVLDIDSPITSRFDEIDKIGLEKLVSILENSCDW